MKSVYLEMVTIHGTFGMRIVRFNNGGVYQNNDVE